jgi:hypothetical protein
MKILLTDGTMLWVPEGQNVQSINHAKQVEVLGPRKRVIMTFTENNIVAWWWDNEDVRLEMPEGPNQ